VQRYPGQAAHDAGEHTDPTHGSRSCLGCADLVRLHGDRAAAFVPKPTPVLRLYMVELDNQQWHVEALSMAEAIRIWLAAMVKEGTGWDGDEEPDQVVLVSDEPVIREMTHG
jgi:hypothetical protein